jgi:hypothetical protein
MFLGCMFGMLGGVNVMSLRQVRMVGCFLVVAFFMMLGCFLVMARSVLMMFRCLLVMMGCFF